MNTTPIRPRGLAARPPALLALLAATAMSVALPAAASSHREAPSIAETPKVDGTDLYMFRSYEQGREGYVTIIANYQPIQSPYGGPNYYTMDEDALYEIHIDNDGDAVEDITFGFRFDNRLTNGGNGITLDIGGVTLPIALRYAGPVSGEFDTNIGEIETYEFTYTEGPRRGGVQTELSGATTFFKPLDNVGNKTIPDYDTYEDQFIYDISIPNCPLPGRVFAGQRAEAFAVNLGEVFDLVNLVPLEGGISNDRSNDDLVGIANVTSLAVEVPIDCLTGSGNGVIGGWTTASLPQAVLQDPLPGTGTDVARVHGGAWTQVSRLGMPLVNEVVIGLPFKDLFNASLPTADAQALDFVTNPTFPAILDLLFRDALGADGNIAPSNLPRQDLVATFLTGFEGVNQLATVTPSEMLRLNTAIAPVPAAQQNNLGVAAGDLAGYPNGRRPGDDTVDITLRVAMGALCYPVPLPSGPTNLGFCTPEDAPVGDQPFIDGAPISATDVQSVFPYLNTPIPGSPDEATAARRGG